MIGSWQATAAPCSPTLSRTVALAAGRSHGRCLCTASWSCGRRLSACHIAPLKRASAVPRRQVIVGSGRTDATASSLQRVKTPTWPKMFEYLKGEGGLKSVEASEAASLMKKGWVLVDVRPSEFHEESHPAGSVNVQLFRKLEGGGSPLSLLKKALYQSQGTYPMEANPAFLEEAEAVAPKPGLFGAKGVIVCCAEGGNMTPTQNLKDGVSARSLVAAYRLLTESDITNVVHLKGGINAWFRAGLPGAGEYEWQFNQRTPSEALSQEQPP